MNLPLLRRMSANHLLLCIILGTGSGLIGGDQAPLSATIYVDCPTGKLNFESGLPLALTYKRGTCRRPPGSVPVKGDKSAA